MNDIEIKEIKPMFTKILLTKDEYTEAAFIEGTGLIDASKMKQGVKEYQKVISVGNMVREVKPGDLVCINPAAYSIKKYKKGDTKEMMEEYTNQIIGYAFPTVELDGKEYLYLDERDIDFVITKYNEV